MRTHGAGHPSRNALVRAPRGRRRAFLPQGTTGLGWFLPTDTLQPRDFPRLYELGSTQGNGFDDVHIHERQQRIYLDRRPVFREEIGDEVCHDGTVRETRGMYTHHVHSTASNGSWNVPR